MVTQPTRTVHAGVDTHLDVHVAAVIDDTGHLLGTRSFPTSYLGLRRLESWVSAHGQVGKIGVEGTGSYGLGLQRVLQGAGHTVVEVNRPNRQLRRSKGKSDTVDAEAAARAVLSGQADTTPKSRDGIVESIRVLRVAKQTIRNHMSEIEAQIRHLSITAPDPIRADLQCRTTRQQMARAASYRPGDNPADLTCATKTALRMLARQWQHLDAEFKTVRDQLRDLAEHANPSLLQLPGVGGDTATAILTAVGDNVERIPHSAAFAALCGVSPIEASSGKSHGHRLNRGGNRQANAALHRIVVVRISRKHPETMAYIQRRTSEGKSRRAIIRCLKRYVARQVYQALTDPQPVVTRDRLRPRRLALGLPLRVVAEHFQRPINAVVRIEKGIVHDPQLSAAYDQWLSQQEQAASAA